MRSPKPRNGGNRVYCGKLATTQATDELAMVTVMLSRGSRVRKQGDATTAKVTLNDGRVIDLAYDCRWPCFVSSRDTDRQERAAFRNPPKWTATFSLANEDQLPQDAKLTFSVRAQSPPASFTRDEKIEVATADVVLLDRTLCTLDERRDDAGKTRKSPWPRWIPRRRSGRRLSALCSSGRS